MTLAASAIGKNAAASGPPAAPAPLVAAAIFASALVVLPIGFTIIQAYGRERTGRGRSARAPAGWPAVVQHGRLDCRGVRDMRSHRRRGCVVCRTDGFAGPKGLGAFLAVAPLAVPPFISSYAWVSLSNGLQDFAGALLVVITCAYYPLVYLPVAAALRGLDPALEETARSLGRDALGMLLSGRPAAASSRPLRRRIARRPRHADRIRRLFAAALSHLHYASSTPNTEPDWTGPSPSLLALVLVALCLACLIGELRVRGGGRYARVGAGTRRNARLAPLGWARWPALPGSLRSSSRRWACRWAWSATGCCNMPRPRLRPSRLRCRFSSPRRWLPSAMALAGAAAARPAGGAPGLSHDPLSQPLDRPVGADRLSRAGRAGHRRRAGVDLPDGPIDPPAVSERRLSWCSPTPFCSCRLLWSASARRWHRSHAGSRRPLARSGSDGSLSRAGCSRRCTGPGLGARRQRLCSCSSPRS